MHAQTYLVLDTVLLLLTTTRKDFDGKFSVTVLLVSTEENAALITTGNFLCDLIELHPSVVLLRLFLFRPQCDVIDVTILYNEKEAQTWC